VAIKQIAGQGWTGSTEARDAETTADLIFDLWMRNKHNGILHCVFCCLDEPARGAEESIATISYDLSDPNIDLSNLTVPESA